MGGEGGNALGACGEEITGDGPLSLMKGEGGRRGGKGEGGEKWGVLS